MHHRTQQQTLSIRVSESFREFLELSRKVMADGRGDNVSTSDVAKLLLESARNDRLDFRLEVAELQQAPTASLGLIRKKWQQQQSLSRAEWTFLARYIQVACEELSENPQAPSPCSIVTVLEAVLAVRSLRTDRGGGLDRYYLSTLGVPVSAVFNERQFDPEVLPQVVGDVIQDLLVLAHPKKIVFAGRNLYVALRDEVLSDSVALDRSLTPLLGTLFRLAARGHWIRERRPIRMDREVLPKIVRFEPLSEGTFSATASLSRDGELELLLTMHSRGVTYPVDPYPEIQEFGAMLHQLDIGQTWSGVCFNASADTAGGKGPAQFHFCRRADRVLFTFTEQEWKELQRLLSLTVTQPEVQAALAGLSLEYGEI